MTAAQLQPDLFALLDRIRKGRPTIQTKFVAFHNAHPQVYAEIVRLARDWRSRGRDVWSIDAAYQVIRYQRRMADLPDPREAFKLDDHYRSRYARLIMAQEPDLAGIFDTRTLTA